MTSELKKSSLKLKSDIDGVYIFTVIQNEMKNNNNNNNIFDINSDVTLTNGKFPLDNYLDIGTKYIIDNEEVFLDGFCISCRKSCFKKHGTPTITISNKKT
jgi:hypothetical protein